VVDDRDLGRELVGLLQVLGGEQDGDAVGDQGADHVPDLAPAARVQAGGRLVQAQDRRPSDQARGQVQAAAHPARVGLDRAPGRVGEAEAGQQLAGPGPGVTPGQLQQPADQDQVLGPAQLLVDGGVLAGQPDQAPDPVTLGDDVEAADAGPALVRAQQGREHAHGGGLARAVRAEQPVHRAGLGGQVDSGECRRLPEPLDQALGLDHMGHGCLLGSFTSPPCPGPLTAAAHRAERRGRLAEQPVKQ
jgi:hypothetical protein